MTGLHTMTIAGADDEVDPRRLWELSQEYTFVEWAILLSATREGSARYPSAAWIKQFRDCFATGGKLSGHLCGALARAAISGEHWILPSWAERIQLNGWSELHLDLEAGFRLHIAEQEPSTEFIVQATEETAFREAIEWVKHRRYANVSVLWDPSGGQGIQGKAWPSVDSHVWTGYAGGINAENICDVLEDLSKRERPFWIDMESGVRTDDHFDLGKVREILERATQFLHPAGVP